MDCIHSIRCMPLSDKRTKYKILGIIVIIVGAAIAIYSLLQGSTDFTVQVGGVRPEAATQYGSTRFYQIGGTVGGLIVVYFGVRAFTFIPYSERDEGPIEYDTEYES
ncbi:MAG: hypothetical protein QF535_20220 [Anaerolineales bacterium]|nr:hypothetical protein [Anaerolineales bacterium]